MLYRLRSRLRSLVFNRQIADVLKSPPLRLVDAPWSIISMVKGSDIPMYLLAIKSFYRRVGRGRITVIIDRDLGSEGRDTIARHIPGVEFIILEDVETGQCPRGGTWERLVFLVDRSAHEYSIQLDADTLSFGSDLSEIVACAERNLAFTMSDAHVLRTMRDAAGVARVTEGNYVGIAAERMFDKYPDCDKKLYIRGSSGLAGFAKGAFARGELEAFHRNMVKLLPTRWNEWGTEQCGSNFAVANSPNAVVLPDRVYASFNFAPLHPKMKFLHFIGSHRYNDGVYASLARRELAAIFSSEQDTATVAPALT